MSGNASEDSPTNAVQTKAMGLTHHRTADIAVPPNMAGITFGPRMHAKYVPCTINSVEKVSALKRPPHAGE